MIIINTIIAEVGQSDEYQHTIKDLSVLILLPIFFVLTISV